MSVCNQQSLQTKELSSSSTMISPPPWESLSYIQNEENDTGHIRNDRTVFSAIGNGPLVLAAPHGGNLRPDNIPDRKSGCFEPDTNSAQLAWSLYQSLRPKYHPNETTDNNNYPSLIIGKIHREKVDYARPQHTSCYCDSGDSSSSNGRRAWDEYHSAIQEALDRAIENHGKAHLIDIHGQNHRDATEIGHMLTNSDLVCCDTLTTEESAAVAAQAKVDITSTEGILRKSSIGAMSKLQSFISAEDIIRGPYSIGTLLDESGYPAVPSRQTPYPCCVNCKALVGAQRQSSRDGDDNVKNKSQASNCPKNNKHADDHTCPCTGFDAKVWGGNANGNGFGPCSFFWGGNTLGIYGGGRQRKNVSSTDGQLSSSSSCSTQLMKYQGFIAATQIETPWKGTRQTDDQIDKFGSAIANAIYTFMEHFYDYR